MMPRVRAWMFSSVVSGGRPAKIGFSIASNASTAGSMGIVS